MTIRRKLISAKVEEILSNLDIENPPIDVQYIAESHFKIKITRSKAPSQDISGFLFIDGFKKTIGLNSDNGSSRQRFTIAHEIGHLVLDHCKGLSSPHIDKVMSIQFRDSNSSSGVDENEIEANLFAAELLMPNSLIHKELEILSKNKIIDIDVAISTLAVKFDVSEQALTIRLSNLGFIKF